jgi:hypothetical protein
VEATGNQVLRYMAILNAAAAFGLDRREVEAVAGDFDPRRTRCDQLADALADLILARSATGECSGSA